MEVRSGGDSLTDSMWCYRDRQQDRIGYFSPFEPFVSAWKKRGRSKRVSRCFGAEAMTYAMENLDLHCQQGY